MKVDLPLCSVVIPLYEHERYIAACLESVYRQTYPRLELIVIDDCSRDRGFEIVQDIWCEHRFASRFERGVIRRNNVNSGAHHSLNRGIAKARGDYVFLLNSDDRFLPERIATMSRLMSAADSRFAFSSVDLVCDPGAEIPPGLLAMLHHLDSKEMLLPAVSFEFLRHNCAVTTGNFAFRRDLLDQVGPFARLQLTHDWDFALRTIVHEEPLYVREMLYEYRLHERNTFASLTDRAAVESAACLRRYFTAISCGFVGNSVAPTPSNWPGIFEFHLEQLGLKSLWQRTVQGKVRGGRTYDATPH